MATQIEFKGNIKIDFERVLQSVQEEIRNSYACSSLSVTELTKKLSSIDIIHKAFCKGVEFYIDTQDNYKQILHYGGEATIEKIKTVFYDWLVVNKEKYGLHMKAISGDNIIISEVPGYEGLPSVLNLGDGVYVGRMAGHSFIYDGVEYYSEIGVRCPFYTEEKVHIVNGKQVY